MANNPWDGRWKRLAKGDAGGQGLTFHVREIESGRDAIMKILRPNREKDAKSRQRMHLEVTSLSVLAAAGADVPHVLDSNTSNFADESVALYFVMDRIDGSTLAQFIVDRGSMRLVDSISVVTALCSTLRAAFDRDLGHRDIKPENIILRNDRAMSPVMVDFGLTFNSEVVDVTQPEDGFDNQFLSMPERRAAGENRRDPRSDLTGVVAILYYCLTGLVPRVLRDSSDRPPHRRAGGTLVASIGSERQLRLLNALFDRAFSQEMAMRVQSLDELLNRLSEISADAESASDETLEAVVARNHAMLMATDRTTKLSLYRNAAKEVEKRFKAATKLVDAKLTQYPRFSRAAARGHFNLPETPSGDKLADGIIFSVQVQGHPQRYAVNYVLHTVGDEAVISRIMIREGGVGSNVFESRQRGSGMTVVSNWEVIDRYSAGEPPPEGVIEKDYERQMMLMIDRLCREILHPSAE